MAKRGFLGITIRLGASKDTVTDDVNGIFFDRYAIRNGLKRVNVFANRWPEQPQTKRPVGTELVPDPAPGLLDAIHKDTVNCARRYYSRRAAA